MNSRIAALGGVVAIWAAVASPAAHLEHHLLTGHMVQHLLLMLVAAPLMLFAPEAATFLYRSVPLAFCWLAGSLTVIFWHVPAVLALTLRSHYWHALEQVSFFIGGVLFWQPAVRSMLRCESSGWSVPVYLFLATFPCDALSAYLAFCGHIVYPAYAFSGKPFGLSPIDDQALAGALMWVAVTFAYLIPALTLSGRLLSSEPASSIQVRAI